MKNRPDQIATRVAIPQQTENVSEEIFSTDAVSEFHTLDSDIASRSSRWVGKFTALMDEFAEEIVPLLDRMNSLLSYHSLMHTPGLPGFGEWYEKYRRSINLTWHMRTVQRKLQRFRGEEPRRLSDGKRSTTRKTQLTPEQRDAANNLENAKEELGAAAAAGSNSAAAIITDYQQAYDAAMANGTPETKAAVTLPHVAVEDVNTSEERCVCRNRGNLDADDYVPIPLATLAERLMGVADELRCAWCLDGFADQIDAIAERVDDREELDRRLAVLAKRMAKSPSGVSSRYIFKSLRRDRRHQEDMRFIVQHGGTTYRGQKILGGDDPYIWRFTRGEVTAELKNDLDNQLGVGAFPEY